MGERYEAFKESVRRGKKKAKLIGIGALAYAAADNGALGSNVEDFLNRPGSFRESAGDAASSVLDAVFYTGGTAKELTGTAVNQIETSVQEN